MPLAIALHPHPSCHLISIEGHARASVPQEVWSIETLHKSFELSNTLQYSIMAHLTVNIMFMT